MSALRLGAATLALAAAALATGCSKSKDEVRYPAGWSPLAAAVNGCPDLEGTWRVDGQPGDITGGIGVLAYLGRDGGLHTAAMVKSLADNPGQIGDVTKTMANFMRGFAGLKAGARLLHPRMAFPD